MKHSATTDAAQDAAFMREAVAEARLGEGGTRPNPPVGCVIAHDGHIVARGHHAVAGGPHAEIVALSQLDANATNGATLYVTLEPCSTQGRTPPCTDAIIRAGISHVVIATTDPNPAHAGRGIDILRTAGIAVTTGVCEDDARETLAPFFKWITTRRPFVTLKMAQSLDGGIADHAGQSKWITGAAARAEVRNLRRRADAVLVGRGTVLADNPSLLRDTQLCDANSPEGGAPGLRIVMDSAGTIPMSSQIFTDGHAAQTIYATTGLCHAARLNEVAATGATVWVLPTEFPPHLVAGSPRISLRALFEKAGEEGLLHILCEGGAELASALVNEALVDELIVFVAPIILGADAKRTFGKFPFDLPTAPRFDIAETKQFGADLMIRMSTK